MLNKNNKNKLRITNEQIDKLRILETLESFQTEVINFRKKFFIDISKDISNSSFGSQYQKITPEECFTKLNEALDDISKIGKKFNLLDTIVDYYLWSYLLYNKWSFETAISAPINYRIVNNPIARMGKDGKMKEYSKTVSLITSARLSTKEEKMALKDLRERQKLCLEPNLIKQVRRKKDIQRDLAIEKEMETREPKHKEEELSGYLKLAKPSYDKGQSTMQKFNELKKLHPDNIKIIKKGKTSLDVAKNVLGNKKHAVNARQIYSRIKKKKQKIFKDNL